MQAILPVCVLSVPIAIYFLVVAIINARQGKLDTKTVYYFREFVADNQLSLSSQIILKNCIVGFDGINRKLILQQKQDEGIYTYILLKLDEIETIYLKRSYFPNVSKPDGQKQLSASLKRVTLFVNTDVCSFEICFYDQNMNSRIEEKRLEEQAQAWEIFFSKVLKNKA